jgi:hypothetical protein
MNFFGNFLQLFFKILLPLLTYSSPLSVAKNFLYDFVKKTIVKEAKSQHALVCRGIVGGTFSTTWRKTCRSAEDDTGNTPDCDQSLVDYTRDIV